MVVRKRSGILRFLAFSNNEAACHRQRNQVDVEPLAIVMAPDRANLGSEGAFSFARDDEGLVGGLLGFGSHCILR
jgi:hypothetical protein